MCDILTEQLQRLHRTLARNQRPVRRMGKKTCSLLLRTPGYSFHHEPRRPVSSERHLHPLAVAKTDG